MSSHTSSKLAVALLTSVAVAIAGFAGGAIAAPRGGGGPHGGGAHFGGGGGGGGGGGAHFGGAHFVGGGLHGFAGHAAIAHSFTAHAPVTHRSRAATTHNFVNHTVTAHTAVTTHNNGRNAVNGANAAGANGRAAHAEFAARNFHGLYDFHRAGFNRNAFGNGHGWNRWGGRFWGAGWNNWGGGWGGWAGPVFWPYLYGDIFSFAFWPYGYYDPFWAFGPQFILASIFASGPYFGPGYYGYADQPNVYYGASAADRRAMARTSAAAAQSCSGLAPGVTDLPIAQIKKTVRPAGDQVAALDALSAAAGKANNVVASSCPNDIPLTPVARLDAAEQRLKAVIQAVQIVRDPLGKFYDSLSDEQRQKFDAMGNAKANRASVAPTDLTALCGQQSGDVTALPVQRIEQEVQPNAQQQGAFDGLKKASQDIAAKLQASCPTQVPQTPVARLDAVKTRLDAIIDAMNTVRPKLEAFYASLSDEQKAKFNTMGPPKNAAAAPQDQTSEQ